MDVTETGPVVVDELKRQARQEGYVVLAVEERVFWMWVVAVLYFLLGWSFGAGR